LKWVICREVIDFGFMKVGSYYFSHHNKQKGNQDGIMRKIKQVAIIIGISAMAIVGCKGKESVVAPDMGIEITKDTVVESTTASSASGINESKDEVEERWTKLWPGKSMEVNLNAKGELIGGFVKDGIDMYKAVRYDGDLVDENAYCYFFSMYFDKEEELFADLSFPDDLEKVSEELWETEMRFWKSK